MSEIITNRSEEVVRFFKSLDRMLACLENTFESQKPVFGGDRLLTDKELSARLKVSRRTIQEWRTNGLIAYIALGGKCLYRESDIQAMLTKHHRKAWE